MFSDNSNHIFDSVITPNSILLFDMDGTIIDTNYANFLSYKKAVISVTGSDNNLIYNSDIRFNRSHLKTAVEGLTDEQYVKIIAVKEMCYDDFLHETKLNSSIADILIKYSKTNRTVLVTNCRENRAMKTLSHFGLADKFTDTFFRQFSGTEQKINKFQNAISKLGVAPELVIVFENEEIEIADAKQAGVKIINPIIA